MYRKLECALDRETERTRRENALTMEKEKTTDSDEIIILENDTEADKKKTELIDGDKKKKADPRQNFKALVNDFDAFAAFAHFDENICGFFFFLFLNLTNKKTFFYFKLH